MNKIITLFIFMLILNSFSSNKNASIFISDKIICNKDTCINSDLILNKKYSTDKQWGDLSKYIITNNNSYSAVTIVNKSSTSYLKLVHYYGDFKNQYSYAYIDTLTKLPEKYLHAECNVFLTSSQVYLTLSYDSVILLLGDRCEGLVKTDTSIEYKLDPNLYKAIYIFDNKKKLKRMEFGYIYP